MLFEAFVDNRCNEPTLRIRYHFDKEPGVLCREFTATLPWRNGGPFTRPSADAEWAKHVVASALREVANDILCGDRATLEKQLEEAQTKLRNIEKELKK